MSKKLEFEGKSVLITGGTGSFGSTFLKQLLKENVEEVRVLSRDEAKQDELRHKIRDPRARFLLGDVRNSETTDNATKGIDHVFHAAALKQVPSCEFFPLEAVATNVSGSANVARSSIENGVLSAVFLSTDKAVYPINAMGMSKALMEKTVQSFVRNLSNSSTVIALTRYGNVMYSRGSVIPLFVKQLLDDGTITVTHPGMTRFLMSLQDSVALVKHAMNEASPGDLFVRKAPAATLDTLAGAIAKILGKPLRVKTLGIRHGEKMHESLMSSEERLLASDEGDYFRVPLDTRSLDYAAYFEKGMKDKSEGSSNLSVPPFSSDNARRLDEGEVIELLLSLPEFSEHRDSPGRNRGL